MIKTIYTCDKCGKDSSEEKFQLFRVAVGCYMVYPTQLSPQNDALPAQHWCRNCLIGSALLATTDKMLEERRLADMSPVVPATLEDMIREIASEAGQKVQ